LCDTIELQLVCQVRGQTKKKAARTMLAAYFRIWVFLVFGATRPFLHQRHRKSIKIKEENGGCESHGKNPNTVPDAPPTKPARFIHKNAEQQNIYTNKTLKNTTKRNNYFV